MKKYIQEHKYVLLVLYVPVYLIWFALAEHMVPTTDGCWVSYLPLDDKIPFCRASFWHMCSGIRF